MKQSRISVPVLAASLALASATAWADHNEGGHDHRDKEHAAEAAHDEPAPGEADAMPSNDLSTSLGSKISAPSISGGSLHASPKILNNAGVSNDLKTALQPEPKPAGAPSAAGDPAIAAPQVVPATTPAEPAVAAANKLELEVAPPADALLAETGAPKATGAPKRTGGLGSLLPLIGIAALALVGGVFAARLMRGRNG